MILFCTNGRITWHFKRASDPANDISNPNFGQQCDGEGATAFAVPFTIHYGDGVGKEEFLLVYSRNHIEWGDDYVNGVVFYCDIHGHWRPERDGEVVVGRSMVVASIRGDTHPSFSVSLDASGKPTAVMRAELSSWRTLASVPSSVASD